jgi:TRAP-type C4-dicarboxylate transport system permease small subunit
VEVVTALLTILFTVVVFLQVVYRYALHTPLPWSEELAMFLFQWCLFLGAAVAVRHRKHFYVDLVVSDLPRQLRRATEILTSAIIFTVAYVMIHMGIKMVVHSMGYVLPGLQFSIAYAYLVFPISGSLMILYQIPIFVRQIRTFKDG